MTDALNYRIMELKEEAGEVWARIKIEKPAEDADLSLDGALRELEQRAAPFGLMKSEALNWMLTHPDLDDFFQKIVEHKKRVMQ